MLPQCARIFHVMQRGVHYVIRRSSLCRLQVARSDPSMKWSGVVGDSLCLEKTKRPKGWQLPAFKHMGPAAKLSPSPTKEALLAQRQVCTNKPQLGRKYRGRGLESIKGRAVQKRFSSLEWLNLSYGTPRRCFVAWRRFPPMRLRITCCVSCLVA